MSTQLAMHAFRRYIQVQLFIASILKHPRFNQLKNFLAIVAAVKYGGSIIRLIRDLGLKGTVVSLVAYLKKYFFSIAKSLPLIKGAVQKQINETLQDIEKSVLGTPEERSKYRKFVQLPEEGLSEEAIFEELTLYKEMAKIKFEDGKSSGTVYNSDPKLTSLLVRAMEKFAWANPLHTNAFPGVRKMESECIQMVVDLFNGTNGVCGSLTSGGTESILMAMRVYREWGRSEKGITEPHMVIPVTAHAAFDKGAEYFGIRITHVPVNPTTKKVDINLVKQAICPNTIMIVGSCPQYPHGIIDDIEALGKIAQEHRVGLHVDCCLGSFIVPFLEQLGVPIRPFDFRVPGVTTISCDTHKYGFAPKGSSIIMYRTPELRRYQYFCQTDWPGGVYASPTMSGSRPGALVVGCWAAMVYFGRGGYRKAAEQILAKTRKMIEAVKQHSELYIMGDPVGSVFSFGSNVINIYQLGGYLHKNSGWDLSYIQFPAGIHVSTTLIMDADSFASDLAKAMSEIRANPSAPANSEAKFYGTASSVPDRSIIDRVARGFVDATYAIM